jgi:undecaprenyl-diphosphatase
MARRHLLVVAAAGVLVLVIGGLFVGDGDVPGWERSLFHAVNDLPGWLNAFFWPGQLIGALFVVPVVAVVALALRKYRLALAAVLVGVLKLVAERMVKAVVTRERPGTSIGSDINARGDVHLTGESLVSGHAILVAGLAMVVAPYVSHRIRVALVVVVVYVMLARIYVGAHNPLDVVCGAGLGVAIGALVNLVLGPPRATESSAGAEAPSPSIAPS